MEAPEFQKLMDDLRNFIELLKGAGGDRDALISIAGSHAGSLGFRFQNALYSGSLDKEQAAQFSPMVKEIRDLLVLIDTE